MSNLPGTKVLGFLFAKIEKLLGFRSQGFEEYKPETKEQH